MAQNGLVGVTNNDLSTVVLGNAKFRDELLKFAGADTFVEGTILARQGVAAAVSNAFSGTGNGTLASTVVGVDEIPIPGDWLLTCTFAVAEGGVFKLTDPNGNIIADNLTLRVGAGLVTTLNVAGFQLVITEGGTDFSAADEFTLTVVVDGDLVPFAIGGVAGAGVPLAVLTYDVTRTGAGDEPIRAMVGGEVRKEKLIIDADGDGSNITDAILDQLRDFSVVSADVQELNINDNQ